MGFYLQAVCDIWRQGHCWGLQSSLLCCSKNGRAILLPDDVQCQCNVRSSDVQGQHIFTSVLNYAMTGLWRCQSNFNQQNTKLSDHLPEPYCFHIVVHSLLSGSACCHWLLAVFVAQVEWRVIWREADISWWSDPCNIDSLHFWQVHYYSCRKSEAISAQQPCMLRSDCTFNLSKFMTQVDCLCSLLQGSQAWRQGPAAASFFLHLQPLQISRDDDAAAAQTKLAQRLPEVTGHPSGTGVKKNSDK